MSNPADTQEPAADTVDEGKSEVKEAAAKIMEDYAAHLNEMDTRQASLRTMQQEQLSAKLKARVKRKEEKEKEREVNDEGEGSGASTRDTAEPVQKEKQKAHVDILDDENEKKNDDSDTKVVSVASCVQRDGVFHPTISKPSVKNTFASVNEWKTTAYDRWYKKLCDASSLTVKPGPENMPFAYKYEARDIWLKLRDELNSFLFDSEGKPRKRNEEDTYTDINVAMAVALLEVLIGCNFVECEENSNGQKYLEHALLTFSDYGLCDNVTDVNFGDGDSGNDKKESESESISINPLQWTNTLPEGEFLVDGVPFISPWIDGTEGSRSSESDQKMGVELAYLPSILHALSQLALLWAERADFDQSNAFLKLAMSAYNRIKIIVDLDITPSCRLLDCILFERNVNTDGNAGAGASASVGSESADVVHVDDVNLTEKEDDSETTTVSTTHNHNESKLRVKRLYTCGGDRSPDETHTHTLFYVAQMLMRTGDMRKASKILYATLYRQLLFSDLGEFSPFEWATNAIGMSTFYISVGDIRQADVFVQAADQVMKGVEHDHKTGTIELDEDDVDLFKRTQAEVCIADGKILLNILRNMEVNMRNTPTDKLLLFPKLNISPNTERFKAIKTFDDARRVFLEGRQLFDKAAESYFVLEGFVSDYVNIQQHISQLFRHLAHYEPDSTRRIAMQKKRLKLLEPLTSELSEIHFFDIMRQMYFEIGETHSAIVTILEEQKEDIMSSDKGKNNSDNTMGAMKVLKKLATHVTAGVSWFDRFLATFNDRKTGEMPTKLDPDDDLRPYLMARFNIAHLSSKIVHPDPSLVYQSKARALLHCEWIVKYADAHLQDTESAFGDELGVCREMARLLPFQLSRMAQ